MSKKETMTYFSLESLAQRDLHVHTAFCDHASGEMEDFVQAALKVGMKEIGFLEHVEFGAPAERRLGMLDRDIPEYWKTGRTLRDKYQDSIEVSLGLEIGVNPKYLDELARIRDGWTWDRIGLSCHLVPFKDGVLNISSRSCRKDLESADHKELTLKYYQILKDHLALFSPDFVCHLDLPRKFMANLNQDPQVREAIGQVLAEMARTGAALEINTSGYEWLGQPYPDAEIIKSSRSLGLNLVLNSDSHHPSQVGRHFERAIPYLAGILGEANDREFIRPQAR